MPHTTHTKILDATLNQFLTSLENGADVPMYLERLHKMLSCLPYTEKQKASIESFINVHLSLHSRRSPVFSSVL